MLVYNLRALPVRRYFQARAVKSNIFSGYTFFLNTSTGFFTLLVGRVFKVETLTVAKILGVVSRQVYSYL